MKNTSKFTGYDASEGALYVLFMLCLAMHPQSPSIFAVDSFDHALNPRLAKKMIEVFCEQIIRNGKQVFLTTHNPRVLDGLNLANDDIRLFAVDRDKDDFAQIQRIIHYDKLVIRNI
ncbi:MAG: ATP-binding protein [Lachnospiraceae bacterium]|nr:ATP-binding protein [Lachnospiraceae bacterium]